MLPTYLFWGCYSFQSQAANKPSCALVMTKQSNSSDETKESRFEPLLSTVVHTGGGNTVTMMFYPTRVQSAAQHEAVLLLCLSSR